MGGSVDEHGPLYDKIGISMNGICCYFVFQRHQLSSADDLHPALFELPIFCSHLVMHTVPCQSLVRLVVRIIRSQILSEQLKSGVS